MAALQTRKLPQEGFGSLALLRQAPPFARARLSKALRPIPSSFELPRAYRCLGSIQINEVFGDEALLLVGQRHFWFTFDWSLLRRMQ